MRHRLALLCPPLVALVLASPGRPGQAGADGGDGDGDPPTRPADHADPGRQAGPDDHRLAGAVPWRRADPGRDLEVEPATATHPGVPAADATFSWRTFEEAAWDAGRSRRYGGIHWQFGDLYARDVGKKVGEGACSLAKKLWEGG